MATRLKLGTEEEQRYGASTAVRAGDRVFVSGLTAAGDGVEAQFRGIAYPRHPQGGKYATATWINMHTIPTGTKILDQAWEFLAWYASLEVVLKRLELLNSYSPRLDLVETPQWKAVLKDFPQLQRAFDVATVGGERPGLRFDQMEAAMKPVFTQVMQGQVSSRVAVQQLDQVTKPLLAELPAAAR